MEVFISWSKPRSKEIANALRDWLPLVLQYVCPFVSDKDISAGERWAQAIAGKLQEANFGIICITPENITSEWILFEAGALSKSMTDGKVIPLLFGLELSDLSGPLSQFQAQKADEAGIFEIVKAINSISEKPVPDTIINRLVPSLWANLRDRLVEISAQKSVDKHKRPQNEILEELVKDVRGLGSSLREIRIEQNEKEPSIRRRVAKISPEILHIVEISTRNSSDPSLPFLMLASFLREDALPISEILLTIYREINTPRFSNINPARKSTLPSSVLGSINNLELLIENGMMFELGIISKNLYGTIKELPMYLRHLVETNSKFRKDEL